MSTNERELIEIIRTSEEPEKAFEIAVKTILLYLEHPESYQAQSVVAPLAPS